MDEAGAILMLCAMLGGEPEVMHRYQTETGSFRVFVDCETSDAVFELGLDRKSSSFDSLHQVLFAASLTGKTPRIVLIDRDGLEDQQQYQVRRTADLARVAYSVYSAASLVQWQLTVLGDSGPVPMAAMPPS